MLLESTNEIPDCVGSSLIVAKERLQTAGYAYSVSYTKPPRQFECANPPLWYVIRQTANLEGVMLVAAAKMRKEVQ